MKVVTRTKNIQPAADLYLPKNENDHYLAATVNNHNAEVLKEKGLQAQYLIGSNWARNTSAIDLGTHVSGCVLLEAVALDTL